MYTICITLIVIASVLVILAVLVQNPKSGMAANFGASNQVMGVRETSNFLEKFTWTMAVVILLLSLVATMTLKSGNSGTGSASEISRDRQSVEASAAAQNPAMPNTDAGAVAADDQPAEEN